jgi:hypothetical protein
VRRRSRSSPICRCAPLCTCPDNRYLVFWQSVPAMLVRLLLASLDQCGFAWQVHWAASRRTRQGW